MIKVKKILIADDHPLFRDALKFVLRSRFDSIKMPVSGTFHNLKEKIKKHDDADLLLLDLHMPDSVGFSPLHYLKISYPHIPIAIISANKNPLTASRAIKYGADGFIPKSSSTKKNNICGGKKYWMVKNGCPVKPHLSLMKQTNLMMSFLKRLEFLTPKQFDVLMMLMEGRTNNAIADEICVTVATIKAHIGEILKKLEVNNRTQAAIIASNYLDIESQYNQVLE